MMRQEYNVETIRLEDYEEPESQDEMETMNCKSNLSIGNHNIGIGLRKCVVVRSGSLLQKLAKKEVYFCYLQHDEDEKFELLYLAKRDGGNRMSMFDVKRHEMEKKVLDVAQRQIASVVHNLRAQSFQVFDELGNIARVRYGRFREYFGNAANPPRKMVVGLHLATRNNNDSEEEIKFFDNETGKMIQALREIEKKAKTLTDTENNTELVGRLPRFDGKAFRLDFNGRVRAASIRNFQLEGKDQNLALQFGKVAKNRYSMDFGSGLPLSLAFGVCLTKFMR